MKKVYVQPLTELIRLEDHCELLGSSTPDFDGPLGVRPMEDIDNIYTEDL